MSDKKLKDQVEVLCGKVMTIEGKVEGLTRIVKLLQSYNEQHNELNINNNSSIGLIKRIVCFFVNL